MFENHTISTQIILREAHKRGIKITPLFEGKMLELEYKGHVEYLFTQFISGTTAVALKVCDNKEITKALLSKAGVSVPSGRFFGAKSIDEALKFAKEIGYPIVMKPTNSTHGNCVFTNIASDDEFTAAFGKVAKQFKNIIIEKRFEGTEYRIVASREKVLGITNRVPANVIGDGNSTIKQLIEIKNSDKRRGDESYMSFDKPLVKIKIDEIVLEYLRKQGLDLQSVPKDGEQIFLRDNSNLSTGGDSIDFTDKVHPTVKEIAVKAIKAIPGLAYGGIDFMASDITQPQSKDTYVIIEINSSPGIFMHHFPYEGTPREVAKEIVDIAFPESIGS